MVLSQSLRILVHLTWSLFNYLFLFMLDCSFLFLEFVLDAN